MIEDEARAWVADRFGAPVVDRLALFAALVVDEAARQNLISAATMPVIWRRHIVDSAQLVPLAEPAPGDWFDIGSGAGFPGMVVALLTERSVTLVEPRGRRAAFLEVCVERLGLQHRVRVVAARAQQSTGAAAVISARAVAPLPDLLSAAAHLSTAKTLWLLPKGRLAREELADAQSTWQGVFHVEQSITDPQSLIVVARDIARR